MYYTIQKLPQDIGITPPEKSADNASKSQGDFIGKATAFAVAIKRQTSKEPARSIQQSPPPTEHAIGFRTIKHTPVDKHTKNLLVSPENTNKNKTNDNWIAMQVLH